MKVLLKVAKIMPKLGSTNEHEKLLVLLTIERLLSADGISWTDAGMKLSEFLTQIAGIEEEPAIAAPPRPSPGFTRAPSPPPQPAPFNTRGWAASPPPPQPTPRPAAPPPPPRTPRIDPRCYGAQSDKESLIAELITKAIYHDQAEKQTLETIHMMLLSGVPLTPKQQKFMERLSMRL